MGFGRRLGEELFTPARGNDASGSLYLVVPAPRGCQGPSSPLVRLPPGRTAGDQLASFGGFFDEAWREHDYRLGRQTAHELLPEILGVDPYPREEGAEYDNPRDFSRATMKDVPRGKRIRVRDAVLDKAEGLVKEALGGGFKGWVAWKAFVRGKVKGKMEEMLEL